jgi:HEAT repeat protein
MHEQVTPVERLVLVDFRLQPINDSRRKVEPPSGGAVPDGVVARVHRGDVWQRARAIRTLAELADRKHCDGIVEALDDPSAHVAQTAARAYARLGLGPIEALLQRLDRYQPWDRRLLRQTLAATGPAGAPALLEMLQDETQPVPIRVICADALATLGYEGANEAALRVLQVETDVELQAAALRLLRGDVTEAQRAVARTLRSSTEPVLQGQAVACLARIGDVADLVELEAALDHDSPWVRFNAARGLKERSPTVPLPAGAGAGEEE